MAAILGLADEVVEALCKKIHNVWPANYNCPGQLVDLRRDGCGRRGCDEAQREGARRAVRLKVSGAFHSPLVGLAAERFRPAIEKMDFKAPTAHFVSTVTAKLEDATRFRSLLVEQLTAPVKFTQAAREMIGQRRDHVRRGRARQRAQRFTEEDRQLREGDLGQRPEVAGRGRAPAWLSSAPWRGGRRSSPEAHAGSVVRSRPSSRAPAPRSSSATTPAPRRPPRSRPRSAAAPSRPTSPRPRTPSRLVEEAGDLDILVNNAGRDPRRPARPHVRRGLARGDRDEPQLGLLHLPRRDEADDEAARRARS